MQWHNEETSQKQFCVCVFLLQRYIRELIYVTFEQVKWISKQQAGLLPVAKCFHSVLHCTVLKACPNGLGFLRQCLHTWLLPIKLC